MIHKYILAIAMLLGFGIKGFAQKDADRILQIDRYAESVNRQMDNYTRYHRKCCDCFGMDSYYKDSTKLIKLLNYQSCFRIEFYYLKNRLVLVTIDGSFKRTCGWTEANYCWDSSVVRDYKARIYYKGKRVLKISESGTKPCCPIKPCGDYAVEINFDNKASEFLRRYGTPPKQSYLR